MESVKHRNATQVARTQIRPADLNAILDEYSPQIKILSLDCFDTLLWRCAATPGDVFFSMQEKPAFKKIGLTPALRAYAEENARQKMLLQNDKSEVKLCDIYPAIYPELSAQQIADLISDEIEAEKEHCFAFPPIVELIREAHTRGLKIVIVSDTYFEEAQLRQLLEHALPSDVLPMINKIFCSSEYGKSKSEGLLKLVSEKMSQPVQAILHIGDNGLADFIAPKALGMHSLQFVHHHPNVGSLIRMQALAAGFIDPTIRQIRPLVMPYRAILANSPIALDKPENSIGFASLGPIMHAFGRFLCDEINQLKRAGKNPKVVFLMRDAYLPSLACEIIAGEPIGKRVRISRFSSYAASFRTQDDVDQYVGENAMSLRFYDICQQLLLPENIARPLIEKAIKAPNPPMAFVKLIQQKTILQVIFKESRAYRNKLRKHLENEIGLTAGDTLVFVDLGYTGTAQNKLAPVFRDEMNVEVIGRYLIALRSPHWQHSRRGLLDPSWCDDRILGTLVAYIALLEQLCTCNENSVIGYDDDGNPIHAETSLSKQQHTKLDLIQNECLRFIREAEAFYAAGHTPPSLRLLRDAALAELSRLLFIPNKIELDYLKSFQFDLNLGTKEILNVFDQEKGLDGLRKRGMFFMERNLKSMRTNYPAELRYAGLELALLLLAQSRFGFDLRVNDLSLRREPIQTIIIRGNKSMKNTLEALPTYDGYFSLLIPVGNGDFQIAVQFGLHYQWVQLESAELIATATLFGSNESETTEDAAQYLAIDQMIERGSGIYECQSENSLLVFAPQRKFGEVNYTLRIIFRPLLTRKILSHENIIEE